MWRSDMTTGVGRGVDKISKTELVVTLYNMGHKPKQIADMLNTTSKKVRQLVWKRKKAKLRNRR